MTDNPDLDEAIRLLRALQLQWPAAEKSVYWLPNDYAAKVERLLAKYPERPKLDGCPWCGGEPVLARLRPEAGSLRRWRCHNCDAYGPWGINEAAATDAWNRRAKPASGPVDGGKPE